MSVGVQNLQAIPHDSVLHAQSIFWSQTVLSMLYRQILH